MSHNEADLFEVGKEESKNGGRFLRRRNSGHFVFIIIPFDDVGGQACPVRFGSAACQTESSTKDLFRFFGRMNRRGISMKQTPLHNICYLVSALPLSRTWKQEIFALRISLSVVGVV